jgi:hypothetical protein
MLSAVQISSVWLTLTNVIIRFAYPTDKSAYTKRRAVSSAFHVHEITLFEAAHLTGLLLKFNQLATIHPALQKWQLQSQRTYISTTCGQRFIRIYHKADETEPIPISFLEYLRPVLKRLFELFDRKPSDTQVADSGTLTWWEWWKEPDGLKTRQGKLVYSVVAGGGRTVYLDPNA